jgi:hypothetical protein
MVCERGSGGALLFARESSRPRMSRERRSSGDIGSVPVLGLALMLNGQSFVLLGGLEQLLRLPFKRAVVAE